MQRRDGILVVEQHAVGVGRAGHDVEEHHVHAEAAQAADGFHVRWLVFEPDHRVANVLLEELEQARFKRLAGRHLLEEDQ